MTPSVTAEDGATLAPRGGRTVADVMSSGALGLSEALPSDIEDVLLSLARKLETSAYNDGQPRNDAFSRDHVLLDVEIGDIRLIAVRRGTPSPMSMLSPREQEIARMVALGHPNKTIASVLDISSWTVASHLRRIFIKLQVSSRAAMVTCLFETELNAAPGRDGGYDVPRQLRLTAEPQAPRSFAGFRPHGG
jgi:DNA-binding CsgD family transcriptional regulator